MRRFCCILERLRPLLEWYFRGEENFAREKFREIPFAVDIIFAGGKFRAKSKFANIAKISSTRKIGVIQYIGRRMLRMELTGKRKRGRPKRRFMDVVKEDMAEVEVTEEDTVDRNNWKRKIRCGDPWWEKPKEEEEDCLFSSTPLISHLLFANRSLSSPVCFPPLPNPTTKSHWRPTYVLMKSLVLCVLCPSLLLP